MGKLKKLRLFHMEDGEKTPYIYEVDTGYLVHRKYKDEEFMAMQQRMEDLRSGNRTRRPDTIPGIKLHTMAKWATESVAENPIAGTDDLRKAYLAERHELVESFRERGEVCPECKIGTLTRKYYVIMNKKGLI